MVVVAMLWATWRSTALLKWVAGAASADDRLVCALTGDDGVEADEALADGASVEARDTNGITPLMAAAWRGNIRAAKDLVGRGADVGATDKWGNTAIMYACRSDRVEMIDFLLDHGADPSHLNASGQTPAAVADSFRAYGALRVLQSDSSGRGRPPGK
ncbi:MAG TPA: ankyrin repeat domain-containing protein [Tepidisphaeraceae bacterium]|jgi:ankyrin repeat protein